MKYAPKKRINLLFPQDVAEELYAVVPPRQRGRVVAEAVARELRRIKLLAAIERSAGAWGEAAHSELTTGPQIDRWIAKGRRQLGWDRVRSARR